MAESKLKCILIMECHFFHTSRCKNGSTCDFKHTEPKLGYCPKEKCRLCGTDKIKKVVHIKTEPQKVKEVVKDDPEKIKVKEFNGKPAPLPKWSEKEPGTRLLPPVIIGRKEVIPEKEEHVLQQKWYKKPREYRGRPEDRERREGGGYARKGHLDRGRDSKKEERQHKVDEEVYVPEDEKNVDERFIKFNKKEDVAYQAIADGKTKIYKTRLMEAHQDLQIFKPLEKVFQEKLSLDLMFILDCTGSMGQWIQAAKKELHNIIDFVMHEHEGAKIFISVIAYRDIGDGAKGLEVLPFTNKKDIALSFISNLDARGGDDAPQDVCGGFQKALEQDWKSNAKYALLITDAPCHGKRYHEEDDNYPQGDPKGRDPEKQIIQMVEKGINLYGIKITRITNQMFRIFSDVYQSVAKKPMTVADLGKGTDSFGFFVANTVTATLSSSVVNSDVSFIKRALKEMKQMKNDNKLTIEQQISHLMKVSELPSDVRVEQIDMEQEKIFYAEKFVEQPNWKSLQNSERYKVIQHTYFIVKDKGVPINWRNPLLQNSQIESEITMTKTPFAEGGMRYAFYAYDLMLQQKLVMKQNKKHKYNTIKQMSRDLELVYICQHIVNTFNASVVEYIPDTRLLLTFVHTFLIEILELDKLYYAENYIEGVYEKFNNNSGWANNKASESSFISQAFSHYSYQATEGYLMVVDLQGASGILTDPQIHCLDSERFGPGNLGYEGILKFFFNHRCNNYCRQLGLVNPKHTATLPEDFKFYSQRIPRPADFNKQVFTICDLCKGAFTSTSGFVYKKRVQDQLKYCRSCDEKRKATIRKAYCEWCDAPFSSSEYWFKMMRTDFPTLCGDCRKKRRDTWRKELDDKQALKENQPIKKVGEVPKPSSNGSSA